MPGQSLYRLGAVCFVLGGITGAAGQLLHPLPDPDDPQSFVNIISASSNWIIIHLVGLAAFWFTLAGLVALARSINGDWGKTLAWLGLVCAVASTGAATVWMTIDGFGMPGIAGAWAAAPAAEQGTAFRVADAIEEIILALFSINLIFWFGLTFALYGLAIILSDTWPKWLGWMALVGAIGCALSGLAQIYTGRDNIVTHVLVPIFVVLLGVFAPIMGFFMWRRADALAGADAATSAQPLAPRAGGV
jgi:hypothetical protein